MNVVTGYHFEESFMNFLNGFGVFFLGIIMVFIVLLMLILLISLISRSITYFENKKIPQQEDYKETPQQIHREEQDCKIDDLELVAAISATLAVLMGTTTDKLIVKSLRKINR